MMYCNKLRRCKSASPSGLYEEGEQIILSLVSYWKVVENDDAKATKLELYT